MTNEADIWFVFDLIGVLADPSWRDISARVDNPWNEFKVGAKREDEFWAEREDADAYRAVLAFRPQRLALVRALREKGFRIAIATNFSRSWLEELFSKQPDARELFNETVVSEEVRAAKPAEEFWRALLMHAPRGSIFIDDKKENCDAAQRAGFAPIWAAPGVNLDAEVAAIVEKISMSRPPLRRVGA